MLKGPFLPQLPEIEVPAEGWERFLYKATTGSIYAADILGDTELAYKASLVGSSDLASEMLLDDFAALFHKKFPKVAPFKAAQEAADYGAEQKWFPHWFETSDNYLNPKGVYSAVWGRKQLDWKELVNDSILTCLGNWDADFALECIDGNSSIDYDSRLLVCGMLFLCLTWPKAN